MSQLLSHHQALTPDNLIQIVAAAPVGMVVSNSDGSFAYVNAALLDMLGYTEEEIYAPDTIISHPDELALNEEIRHQLLAKPDQPIVTEKHYLHKNGNAILGLVSMVSIKSQNPSSTFFVAQIINISNQKRIEKSVNLFRSMINSSRETMFIIEPSTGKILDSNIQGCESLGYNYQEMLSLSIFDIDVKLSDHYEWDRIIATIRNTKSTLFEGLHRCKDDSSFPIEMSISHIVVDNIEYILALSRDITERKKSESLIWHQANYDSLTELPNRNMFYKRLKKAIKSSKYKNTRFALLCLDLDKFKDINDTLGHYMGDKLLIEIGQRINNTIRDGDTVSRIGGDEFCILIHCHDDSVDINSVAKKLVNEIAKPVTVGSHKIFTSTSIGISFFPDDANDVDSLLKASDQAMYHAKSRGRGHFESFTLSMQKNALEKMRLSRGLHTALQKNQFHIEYQAIFSIENKYIHKAEALLRWNHPKIGAVSPEKFISIAEDNGTIEPIGHWIVEEVISSLDHWQKHFQPNLQISINASPLYFRAGNDQLNIWQEKLARSGLAGKSIVVEITEGLLLETSQQVMNQLLMLRDAGIQVALDDFGTGYSSLAYLKQLDIDYLKIDKTFIDNLKPNSNEEALCQAIIVMAHKLNLEVIAEGIETEEQYQLLKQYGCDYGQGFYFSHPLKPNDFQILLKTQ